MVMLSALILAMDWLLHKCLLTTSEIRPGSDRVLLNNVLRMSRRRGCRLKGREFAFFQQLLSAVEFCLQNLGLKTGLQRFRFLLFKPQLDSCLALWFA